MKLSIILFLIISVGVIIYSNSLGNDFIWDDLGFVITNDFIKSLKFVSSYFISPDALAKGGLCFENYRPFLPLSYAVDYAVWKLNPMGYHITNLLFHILNAICVFFLILGITKDRFVGMFTALIFLTHPIQTEAVTWISGRADVLFLFFFLVSLISYIKYVKRRRISLYFISLLSFLCGLMSKEMAATLPFVMILYDLYYVKKDSIAAKAARYFPFFLLLEIYIFIRFNTIGKFAQCDYWTGSFYTTFLTMINGIAYYVKLLFYPVRLCADYLTFPITYTVDLKLLMSLGILILLLSLALLLARRLRHISFGILWFFVTLLPVMNIIPVRILIAERFLYLPSIGFAFSAVVLFQLLGAKLRRNKLFRNSFVIFPLILTCWYSILTMERNEDWADEIAFNKKIIEVYPDNARAHHNLAVAYLNLDGNSDRSYEETKKALALAPDYTRARLMITAYYVQDERFDEALNELRAIEKNEPYELDVYRCFAIVYVMQKKYGEAILQYEKILAFDPTNLDAKFGLAAVSEIKGETDAAIKQYRDILSNKPLAHYQSHFAVGYLKLGDLYAQSGKKDKAIEAWRKVRTDYKDDVWFNEISKYLVGEISMEELMEKTDHWQPEFKVITYYYIGVRKEMDGDIEGAIENYRKSTDVTTQKVDYIKAFAQEKLEKLEKGE